MTPDEQNQEAIKRAIQAYMDQQGQQQTPARSPEQAAQAENTPGNQPQINANQPGQGLPPTPPVALNAGQPRALNPEQTMQQDPTNLRNALQQKDKQKILEGLMNAARQ